MDGCHERFSLLLHGCVDPGAAVRNDSVVELVGALTLRGWCRDVRTGAAGARVEVVPREESDAPEERHARAHAVLRRLDPVFGEAAVQHREPDLRVIDVD